MGQRMRDSEILHMLKNDCPMCGPADCACTATEQDQYREIQRLSLTHAERDALVELCCTGEQSPFPRDWRAAATVRKFLERVT